MKEFTILKTWFTDFKDFSDQLEQCKRDSDLKRFKALIGGFLPIQAVLERNKMKLAPNYNIFYILRNILIKEDETHSPILADLLNVHGKHQQKRLFYDEFIKQLNSIHLKNKFEFTKEIFFSVQTEKETGDGRIDIFIQYNSPIKRFAIAIENKVFAPDQRGQLERYSRYLENEFGNNFLLLYLTPDERPPTDYSISKDKYIKLETKGLIKLISYQKNIILLLENSIPKIESEKVKLITKQYLQIIKNKFRNE